VPHSTALNNAPTAGALLAILRDERIATRATLGEKAELSRLALNQRLALLLDADLVCAAGQEPSTGGRPPIQFQFNPLAGFLIGADLGISVARIAITDLVGRVLAYAEERRLIEDGPEVTLPWVARQAESLLSGLDKKLDNVWGVGVGVPGPVEFEAGRVVSAPFMSGWDHYPIRLWFEDRFGCPAVIDKDANIMALGEHRSHWRRFDHILYVKAGTGVGCGVIAMGDLHRGANGSAGDIGHIQHRGDGEPLCRCGKTGCVEAVAGGWALVRDLRAQGIQVSTAEDVVRLAGGHDRVALQAIRRAGRVLGEVLADVVNFFNPSVVIVGGTIGQAEGELLAGIRETVYQRSLTLATKNLLVVPSALGLRAGVIGAAQLVSEAILAPGAIDQRLAAMQGRSLQESTIPMASAGS